MLFYLVTLSSFRSLNFIYCLSLGNIYYCYQVLSQILITVLKVHNYQLWNRIKHKVTWGVFSQLLSKDGSCLTQAIFLLISSVSSFSPELWSFLYFPFILDSSSTKFSFTGLSGILCSIKHSKVCDPDWSQPSVIKTPAAHYQTPVLLLTLD